MLGNFEYCNPTKLYFGDESLKYLNEELPKYGSNVVLVYGGGSIKKNGIYEEVVQILKANGKNIILNLRNQAVRLFRWAVFLLWWVPVQR